MKRSLIITILSLTFCGLIFLTGSVIGSMFNHRPSDAAEINTCTALCPGIGSGGVIGGGAPINIPSGGVGGSVAP